MCKGQSTDGNNILWEHCVWLPLARRWASPLQIKTFQKLTTVWIHNEIQELISTITTIVKTYREYERHTNNYGEK